MFTNFGSQDNSPSCDCLLLQEAPNSDLEMACLSFGCKTERPCTHRNVERYIVVDWYYPAGAHAATDADHSCCYSDCADKVVHFAGAVVAEEKTLDAKGDHCFPEPNVMPFAFSDPKCPKKRKAITTRLFSVRHFASTNHDCYDPAGFPIHRQSFKNDKRIKLPHEVAKQHNERRRLRKAPIHPIEILYTPPW